MNEREAFSPSIPNTPERWLYHFTTLSTGIEDILANQTIRMNTLRQVNDPKESRLAGFFAKVDQGFAETCHEEFANAVRDYLRDHVAVLCATEDTVSQAELRRDITLRPACFKPTMWAHYGDLHRGLCLVFDREKLQKTISQKLDADNAVHFYGSVEYRHELFDTCYGVTVEEMNAAGDDVRSVARHRFETNHRELLLWKHLDWEHESEWRAIAFAKRPSPIDVPFDDALESVVVSMDFPTVYRDVIRDLAWKNDAGAHAIDWSVKGWSSYNLMNAPVRYEPRKHQILLAQMRSSDGERDA